MNDVHEFACNCGWKMLANEPWRHETTPVCKDVTMDGKLMIHIGPNPGEFGWPAWVGWKVDSRSGVC